MFASSPFPEENSGSLSDFTTKFFSVDPAEDRSR